MSRGYAYRFIHAFGRRDAGALGEGEADALEGLATRHEVKPSAFRDLLFGKRPPASAQESAAAETISRSKRVQEALRDARTKVFGERLARERKTEDGIAHRKHGKKGATFNRVDKTVYKRPIGDSGTHVGYAASLGCVNVEVDVKEGRAGVIACLALMVGCSDAAPPKDDPTASAEPMVSASASTRSSAALSVVPPPPPTLGMVEVHADELKGGIDGLFAIDGGVMIVTSTNKVSRITPEGVESVGEVPHPRPRNTFRINSVGGKYPERVHVILTGFYSRVPMPTYWPITSGGGPYTSGINGDPIRATEGVVHVGETTLVVVRTEDSTPTPGMTPWSYQIISARGPLLPRAFTSADNAGCTEEEVRKREGGERGPAISPSEVAASAKGTMISLGRLCDSPKRGTAIEVWKAGESSSTIVSLKDVEGTEALDRALGGPGDVIWLAGGNVVLQLEVEKVTPLPPVPGKWPSVFVSSERVLHAAAGQSIYRFEEGAWRKVADLQWSLPPGQLAIGGGDMWAIGNRKLYRLQPAPSLAVREGCATPFVWLYDVAEISEPSSSFPDTRKALVDFDQVDQLGLVDFHEGVRRLGLTVPSREVGEAVIAHLKKTMKDEEPRLICHQPKGGRTIPISTPAGPK